MQICGKSENWKKNNVILTITWSLSGCWWFLWFLWCARVTVASFLLRSRNLAGTRRTGSLWSSPLRSKITVFDIVSLLRQNPCVITRAVQHVPIQIQRSFALSITFRTSFRYCHRSLWRTICIFIISWCWIRATIGHWCSWWHTDFGIAGIRIQIERITFGQTHWTGCNAIHWVFGSVANAIVEKLLFMVLVVPLKCQWRDIKVTEKITINQFFSHDFIVRWMNVWMLWRFVFFECSHCWK